jgi:SAM-dependent methyltransferase
MGVPTVALWGPSDARVWGPLGAESEVAISVEGLDCYPCGTTGCEDPVCLRNLDVEAVLGTIARRWGGVPAARPLPRAVELGAGERPVAGALHVDMRPLPGVDVVADVRRLPFRTGAVGHLHAAHLIEHFPRRDLPGVTAEWRRAVAPGGALSVITPNLGYVVEEYRTGRMTHEEASTRIFGGQDYAGNFHYHVFDAPALAETLRAAGFGRVYDTTSRHESRAHPMSLYAVALAPGAEVPVEAAARGDAWSPARLTGIAPERKAAA